MYLEKCMSKTFTFKYLAKILQYKGGTVVQ